MNEIWKVIEDFNCYQISNTGLVKSKNGILKPRKNRGGYLYLTLNKKTVSIHRLVAITFIPNPDNKPQVNHDDGDKTNNNVRNLEWSTQSENEIHAIQTGLKNYNKGSKHCTPVLQYSLDDKFIAEYYGIKEAKEKLGIKSNHISNVCSGKQKSAYGYIWKYKTKKRSW